MSEKYKILDMLKNDDYVMIAQLMDDEMKKNTLQWEMKRANEPVPFINKGMEDAFNEEEAIILINDRSVKKTFEKEYNSTAFTLRTEDGDIIGEIIYDDEELEDLHDDPAVYFLSDNFVTYNYGSVTGKKQFFLMEAERQDFITDLDIESTVKSLVVAVPSTETDHYLKDCFNLSHEEPIGTTVIGFTPFDEEKE